LVNLGAATGRGAPRAVRCFGELVERDRHSEVVVAGVDAEFIVAAA